MRTSGVVRGTQRTSDEQSFQWRSAIEGRIAEICRELAIEAKRMQRLEQQADELLMVIRESADQPAPLSGRAAANRARRR